MPRVSAAEHIPKGDSKQSPGEMQAPCVWGGQGGQQGRSQLRTQELHISADVLAITALSRHLGKGCKTPR